MIAAIFKIDKCMADYGLYFKDWYLDNVNELKQDYPVSIKRQIMDK